MSIIAALNNATSGLSAAARRAEVTSSNIANATTEGYAKRSVSLAEQVVAGNGAGVRTAGINRAVDPLITADRRRAESDLGFLCARSNATSQLASAVGKPDDPTSLAGAYQRLEAAFRDLAETPESEGRQTEVLRSASGLANTFKTLSTENTRMRQDADVKISRQVSEVNSALKKLERVNREIRIRTVGKRDTTALEDERQRLVDQISSRLPIRQVRRENNDLLILTKEGIPLLDGDAATISFQAATSIGASSQYQPGGGLLSGLSVNGRDIAPGSGDAQSISSGSLAGLFSARDEIGVQFQNKIDGLAEDLVARFEDTTTDPTLTPGDPGLFTDGGLALGSPLDSGLAARISINDAVDPSKGGALFRLRDGLGAVAPGPVGAQEGPRRFLDALTTPRTLPAGTGQSIALSAVGAAETITSFMLLAGADGERDFDTQSGFASGLREAESNSVGVNVDEELQSLILIEQSYAANAKILEVADRMLQLIVRI